MSGHDWDEPHPCRCGHDLEEHETIELSGEEIPAFFCGRCGCDDFDEDTPT